MCDARWWPLLIAPMAAWAQGYSDPKACASCHPAIAKTYRQNGMGRSFALPRPEILIEDFTRKNSYYHQPSDTHFQMIRRGGVVVQRRYQIGLDGQVMNVDEKTVDYIVGSGNHMRTYVHRNADGTLLQLPLAWYAEKGGYWAMNPGFDTADYPYALRRISYDCMFCHNAYPETPAGHDRLGDLPVYSGAMPEGIDCQRCHGPGQRHVEAAARGAKLEDIRAAIVNPARLSHDLQMDVCAQCHLKTTEFRLPHAIKRYERGDFSYRPGEPMTDFALAFDEAPGSGRQEKFETASAVTRLRESKCFLASKGAITCTTCHNPHDVKHGGEGAAGYDKACASCHAKRLPQLVAAGRHTAQTGCIDCHMPKRRTEDIVHMAVTDHRIQRVKPAGDLLAERPEYHEDARTMYQGEVVRYQGGSGTEKADDGLYDALAQVRDGANLKNGIPRLKRAIESMQPARPEPYFELANAYRDAGQSANAVAEYREALRRDDRYVPALLELTWTLKAAGNAAEAMAQAKHATEIAVSDARAWNALGQAQLDAGQPEAAVVSLRRALALDPELPAAHNGIGVALAQGGDIEKASAEFQEAIRLQPNYGEAHGNWANLLASKLEYRAASLEFETAIRAQPNDFGAWFNYASMLNGLRRFDDAAVQVEGAIRANPKMAEAHEMLGTLLERRGDAGAALTEYREAVRLKPEWDRAQLDLGATLLDQGVAVEAKAHLEIAAKSADPNLREMAAGLLRRIP